MRIGMVRGRVVLNSAVESLRGTTLLMVEPVNAENLSARNGAGGGKTLVVADRLSPHEGQMIGFVEGREAANAYWPGASRWTRTARSSSRTTTSSRRKTRRSQK